MRDDVAKELVTELLARGFTTRGDFGVGPEPTHVAPQESVFFGDEYLLDIELGELLEIMVLKRDRASRAAPVVGEDAASAVYDDVSLVVDAIKAVIARLNAGQ